MNRGYQRGKPRHYWAVQGTEKCVARECGRECGRSAYHAFSVTNFQRQWAAVRFRQGRLKWVTD
jgi:hypothetical protein